MYRAYLITKDQLKEIRSQGGAGWYNRVPRQESLSVFEGIPAVTITGERREEERAFQQVFGCHKAGRRGNRKIDPTSKGKGGSGEKFTVPGDMLGDNTYVTKE